MKRGSSAGGLKVKALGQTPRDTGSSPAQHYTFCLYEFTLRENYLFIIHISELRNVYLDDGRPSMHMHMCIVLTIRTCMQSKTRWPLDSGMFDQVLDQTISS